LGLVFDRMASGKHMVGGIIGKARKAMYWLIRHVQSNRWNMPHLRLVLADVYVRSILQFGCVVWAPMYLNSNCMKEHAILKPIFVQHR
jgi:hypothetical protein